MLLAIVFTSIMAPSTEEETKITKAADVIIIETKTIYRYAQMPPLEPAAP